MLRNHHDDSGTPENYALSESVTRSTYKCHPQRMWTRRMRKGRTDFRGRPPKIEPDPCFSLTICSYGDGGGVKGSQIEIDSARVAH